MLDLKALLAKIIDYFTLKTTTATKYGNVWQSGSINIYKRSGIVTVKINGVTISSISARTQIATVPAGFIPPTEIGAPIDGTNIFWFVDSTGALKINATSARTMWAAMTYLVGGVIESIKRFFTSLSSPKDWGWAMC